MTLLNYYTSQKEGMMIKVDAGTTRAQAEKIGIIREKGEEIDD